MPHLSPVPVPIPCPLSPSLSHVPVPHPLSPLVSLSPCPIHALPHPTSLSPPHVPYLPSLSYVRCPPSSPLSPCHIPIPCPHPLSCPHPRAIPVPVPPPSPLWCCTRSQQRQPVADSPHVGQQVEQGSKLQPEPGVTITLTLTASGVPYATSVLMPCVPSTPVPLCLWVTPCLPVPQCPLYAHAPVSPCLQCPPCPLCHPVPPVSPTSPMLLVTPCPQCPH